MKKSIADGQSWPDGKTATFTLTDVTDGAPMPASGGTTVILSSPAEGSFGTITYSLANVGQTYEYRISETSGFGDGWAASGSITAYVTVTDNGDGTLATSVTYSPSTDNIVNTYQATTRLVLKSSKTIEDNDGIITETHDLPFELWRKDDWEAYKEGDEEVTPLISRHINVIDDHTTEFDYPVTFTLEPNPQPEPSENPEDVIQVESLPTLVEEGKAVMEVLDGVPTYTIHYILDERTVVDRELKPPDQTYEIIVTIEDDGEGNLDVTKLQYRDIRKDEPFTEVTPTDDGVEFEVGDFLNRERTNSEAVTFFGTKKLSGRSLEAADSWTFTLTALPNEDGSVGPLPENPVAVYRNGEFQFSPIIFTPQQLGECSMIGNSYTCASKQYTYRVVESGIIDGVTNDLPKDFTVTVYLDDKGNVQVDSPSNLGELLTFNNTYTAGSTSIQFGGTKIFTGLPAGQSAPQFTYTLKDSSGTVIETQTTTGAGNYQFAPITYTEAGEYTYTVAETAGNEAGVIYDTNSYNIRVVVTDDGSGQLKKTVTITDSNGNSVTESGLNFTNRYVSDATIQFRGTKTITGENLGGAVFYFELRDSNGKLLQTVANEGSDIIFGVISFSEPGTYTYTIREAAGNEAGVIYDTNSYNIRVVVTDDGSGQLKKTVTITDSNGNIVTESGLNFTNRYVSDAIIQFRGTKTITGDDLEDAVFYFELLDSDGIVLQTVRNNGSDINFNVLSFSTPGTYTYTIREAAGNIEGVTYDTREYTVTVIVSEDENGNLVVTTRGDDPQALDFENEYHRTFYRITPEVPTLPKTGFSSLHPQALPQQPKDLNYKRLNWRLEIPSLDISSDIVEIPYDNGEYPVTWLESDTGLLEGYALPGSGRSVITGHNHLNTMEAGPFALLSWMEEGDRIFVTDPQNNLHIFEVYTNEKIHETDFSGLHRIADMYENSLTMITCEDERAGGGYDNRRIIAAKPVN